MNPRGGTKPSRWYLATVLGSMLLLVPLLAWGVLGALASNSNDPRQWLPRGFEETEKYLWLEEHFGSDEIIVVSWPGCRLQDARVWQLAEALVPDDGSGFFDRAVTGPQIFHQLTSGSLDLSPSLARGRLQGILIGPDGETTCVVLFVSPRGKQDRPAAVEHVYRTAEEACGLPRDQLRLGGPTVDAATIDVESQRLLLELAGLSALVAFIVMWWRLGRFQLALIVLFSAVYGTAVALSILYFTGGHMNLVMTMLPPLVYVLGVSSAVHLVNYYRDAIRETGVETAPFGALAHGWRPCALAAGTTAIGLLSLASSEIVPVRMFGIYSAAGMCGSLAVMLLFLPAALTLWPLRAKAPASAPRVPGSVWIDRVTTALHRYHGIVTVVMLILMVGTGCGLCYLRSTVKLQYRFGTYSRIIQDYRWLESNLGPLVPLEVVLRFTPDCELDFLDRMQLVAQVQQSLGGLEDVGATLSAVDFAPVIPASGSLQDVSRRALLRKRLPKNRHVYEDAHFLAQDAASTEQLWRISLRAEALSDVDYGHFTRTLQDRVEPQLDDVAGVRATYTGMIPLIYKAQRELLNDLVESFLLAFAVIALVMILVLRNPWAGLLAMVPNVFPAVVTFGSMGWLGIWVEIGTVMTASAALGIAVDDTFHYLTWFRRGAGDGMSRQEAMRFAYQRCAGAMLQTTLICACGLIVFSLSSFMPIVRFSRLMATLLAAALLGDLVLLPAILTGPLGKVFAGRIRARRPVEEATADRRARQQPPAGAEVNTTTTKRGAAQL